jgi:hypothetical protein
MADHGLAGIRLRGVDWFSWVTCGGSNVVILTTETGIAEVLVTTDQAWVLTNTIEATRLQDEELPAGFEVWAGPWQQPSEATAQVRRLCPGPVASDRPTEGEHPLPPDLITARYRLLPEDIRRYRQLGQDAAEAVSHVMRMAEPDWSERDLAGAAAQALWARGIHPTLTLTAGERRGLAYRHPLPTGEALGRQAMLVVCGRRHGLYANLTRFVAFHQPEGALQQRLQDVTEIEADALDASRPGNRLSEVYARLQTAYARLGYPGEENRHHQGGPTGYLSREAIAGPETAQQIEVAMALAWNPSLPGVKIEDTVLVTDQGLEVLTVDPTWPTVTVRGRQRPDWLVRA